MAKLTVRVTDAQAAAIRAYAHETGRASASNLIRWLLRSEIRRRPENGVEWPEDAEAGVGHQKRQPLPFPAPDSDLADG